MEFSFLELLEEEYAQCEMKFLDNQGQETMEAEEFYNKYIEPTIKSDHRLGFVFEDDFNTVLSEQKKQSFKDGFRACIQMMAECMAGKAVQA